jgi:hypothetical protein
VALPATIFSLSRRRRMAPTPCPGVSYSAIRSQQATMTSAASAKAAPIRQFQLYGDAPPDITYLNDPYGNANSAPALLFRTYRVLSGSHSVRPDGDLIIMAKEEKKVPPSQAGQSRGLGPGNGAAYAGGGRRLSDNSKYRLVMQRLLPSRTDRNAA